MARDTKKEGGIRVLRLLQLLSAMFWHKCQVKAPDCIINPVPGCLLGTRPPLAKRKTEGPGPVENLRLQAYLRGFVMAQISTCFLVSNKVGKMGGWRKRDLTLASGSFQEVSCLTPSCSLTVIVTAGIQVRTNSELPLPMPRAQSCPSVLQGKRTEDPLDEFCSNLTQILFQSQCKAWETTLGSSSSTNEEDDKTTTLTGVDN